MAVRDCSIAHKAHLSGAKDRHKSLFVTGEGFLGGADKTLAGRRSSCD